MMYELLNDNLKLFIKTFGCVKRRHIENLFGKTHSPKAIKFQMDTLIRDRVVVIDEDGNVSYKSAPPMTREYLANQFKALDVLCCMEDTDIRDFYPAQYPCSLLFITEDNSVYDVTVFDYNNYNALSNLVPLVREAQQQRKVEDIVIHIAVVPDTELIPYIAALRFEQYCVIDEYGNAEFYETN
ncbi:MAG: hypothetical protein II038_14225 [Lachnospiraceae bacterium]|nr:hypothetical protein [Lachnospiraceae bacterium]